MSDNEDFGLYGDGSPEPREGYKGFGYCYPNSMYFDSPIRGPSEEEIEAVSEPPVKVEMGEGSTVHTAQKHWEVKDEVKGEVKEEVKEEIKEEVKEEEEIEQGAEWYRNWVRNVAELSGDEDEEEVEANHPKLLLARRKIQRIYRRAHPDTSRGGLFKKFKRLIRSGNCQGTMIDAIWDEWQSLFHINWAPYQHRVDNLKMRMYEKRHWYASRASWGLDN